MLVAHSTTPNNTQVPCHRVPGAQTCLVFRPVWSASCSSRNDRVSEALSHAPSWKLFRTLTSLPSLASFKDFLLLAWLYPLKSKECLTGMPRSLLLLHLRNITQHCHKHWKFTDVQQCLWTASPTWDTKASSEAPFRIFSRRLQPGDMPRQPQLSSWSITQPNPWGVSLIKDIIKDIKGRMLISTCPTWRFS